MIKALLKELQLRNEEIHDKVETIYFGGGTPSLLSSEEINKILDEIYSLFKTENELEITLEANPDDLTKEYIKSLSEVGVNRLSIGVQSFRDEDLKLMNRAHDSEEALRCLNDAREYFENVSADLIYGIPKTKVSDLQMNIDKMLSFDLPHISAYALTVEPKTALAHFVKEGVIDELPEEQTEAQFNHLVSELGDKGFIHYELSNFGKEGYFSKNNTAYWQGKTYLGIGPSSHSYDGKERAWNVRNNSKYIKSISEGILPIDREVLTITDMYNEYIMTGLRTIWGVDLQRVENNFGNVFKDYLMEQSQHFINEHLLYIDDEKLRLTRKGKFLSDGIASQLFKLNLS